MALRNLQLLQSKNNPMINDYVIIPGSNGFSVAKMNSHLFDTFTYPVSFNTYGMNNNIQVS